MAAPTPSRALCPSRLPNGPANTTWKQRIEGIDGPKKRMLGKKPAGSFAVAVDYRRRDGDVSKRFAFFDSSADLFRQTAYMVQRNFYELIEPGRWTKLYLDIEHYVDSENEVSRVEEAIHVVKEALLLNWPGEFENAGNTVTGAIETITDDVITLTASRYVEVGKEAKRMRYKHSYHVIFPQIYFYGNTGLMKKFVNIVDDDARREEDAR